MIRAARPGCCAPSRTRCCRSCTVPRKPPSAGRPPARAGTLDAIALGEWLHGGDVRAALREPLAYASAGFGDACALLVEWTRRRTIRPVRAILPDGTVLRLGGSAPDSDIASLTCDNAALMKIFAGRPVDPARYQLTGAEPEELVVF